MPVVEKNRT